jgi:hypothetical protein
VDWPYSEQNGFTPEKAEQIESAPQVQPRFEDKLEQTAPISEYETEKATPSSTAREVIETAREEYIQDERRRAQEAVGYRSYYKGGIGLNFDQRA